MPARILSIPFIIAMLTFLFMAWEVDPNYFLHLGLTVIPAAMIYVFSPQINWWWFVRNPPQLDQKIRTLFQQRLPFYQNLPIEDKKRFRDRVALFIIANDFMPQAMESVPEDIKAIVSANAVRLSLHLEEFLFPKFEHIVIYPKPFPSPQYPKLFHASEIYEEDGVLLYSAEQLLQNFFQPERTYNIALHEYAKVFCLTYPDKTYPELGNDIWEKLELISGLNQEFISKWINLPDIDPVPVSICFYFTYPDQFKKILPEVNRGYEKIFRPSST